MTEVQVYDGTGLSPEVLLETVVNLFMEAYPDRFSNKEKPWLTESLEVHFIDLLGEQEALRERGLDLEASPFFDADKPPATPAEVDSMIEGKQIASNGNKAEKFEPLITISSSLRRQRARNAKRKQQ